jgi:hypothetical protein
MRTDAAEYLSEVSVINQLDSTCGISITELDADNLFYSVISKCKEKELLSTEELVYVDGSINRMLEETAKFCRKGYIKQDVAIIMLKNVFMILDSLYSVTDFPKIIEAVRDRKLYDVWQEAIRESGRAFDRATKNFANLDHLARKNPELCADFAVSLKNDVGLSNIFTFSLDRAVYTKEFFGLGDRVDYRTLSEKSEILCTEFALLDKRPLCDIYPILGARGAAKREGVITYNSELIDSVVISMCFSAFYRCDGLFPPISLSREILEILNGETEDELSDSFLSYLNIALARYKIEAAEYEESVGENMTALYKTRVNSRNLKLLAEHLASLVIKYRTSDAGTEKAVHFI